MRVAITGSSGLIGTALSERLASGGHEVVPVRRPQSGGGEATWDPEGGWFREGALEGVDAVVHLAGASIGDARWTESRKRLLRSSRIDATRLLVEAIGRTAARPRVLVSASAVGYYGDRGDEALTEQSARGEGFLAGLVADWESEARRAEEHGVRVALVRSAPVFSSRGGMLPRMLLPFRLGVGGRLGDGRHWMPWIALEDEVEVFVRALNDESLSGPVNAAAPEPVRNADFTRALGSTLGRPTVFPVPRFGLRLLFGRGLADELLMASQRVLPERLQAVGFEFRRQAVDEALRAALGR